jgi:hypothetical protein
MITKQLTGTLTILCMLFSVLFSCKKNEEIKTEQTPASLTKVFQNRYNLADRIASLEKKQTERNYNANSIFSACAGDAFTQSYSITTGCLGVSNSISLTDIIFVVSTKPASVTVELNGISFTPTYVGKTGAAFHHYQLLNIALSSIGISSYCATTTIPVSYYACGSSIVNTDEDLYVNEGISCGSGSYQCTASSTGAGSLSFYLPYLVCGCANMYPPYYTFYYRLQGTSSWTNILSRLSGLFQRLYYFRFVNRHL